MKGRDLKTTTAITGLKSNLTISKKKKKRKGVGQATKVVKRGGQGKRWSPPSQSWSGRGVLKEKLTTEHNKLKKKVPHSPTGEIQMERGVILSENRPYPEARAWGGRGLWKRIEPACLGKEKELQKKF